MFEYRAIATALIDPHSQFDEAGDDFSSQTETWAQSIKTVNGVVSDGTTRLVVRLPATDFISAVALVEAEDGLGGDVGSLETLSDADNSISPGVAFTQGAVHTATSITLTPVHTSAGDYFFCVYRAPEDFVRPGLEATDNPSTERKVALKVELTDLVSGQLICVDTSITVVRPPVVLIHGIWSSADDAFPAEYRGAIFDGGKRFVYVWDYSETDHLSFARNRGELYLAIYNARTFMTYRGIAFVQADVVAHSMGGLLTRRYVQFGATNRPYLRPDNFMAGDVNRLITVNTPHYGTPLGNLGLKLVEACTPFPPEPKNSTPQSEVNKYEACKWLLFVAPLVTKVEPGFYGFDGGAGSDMRPNSPQIQEMGETPVPGHALVSEVQSFAFGQIQERWLWFDVIQPTSRTLLGTAFTPDILFCGRSNDLIVDSLSQTGNMALGQITSQGNLAHTQATKTAANAAFVTDLLETSSTAAVWSHFPPFNPGVPCVPPELGGGTEERLLVSASAADSIVWPTQLTLSRVPDSGAVSPTDTVVITAQYGGGGSVSAVTFVGDSLLIADSTAPYSISWILPSDAFGEVSVAAAALDSAGGLLAVSDVLQFPIEISASLSAITVTPEFIDLLGPNDSWHLLAKGAYDDGFTRTLSTGVSFASDSPAVAIVYSKGLVIGIGQGQTWIRATMGGVSDSAFVTVGSDGTIVPPDTILPSIALGAACPDSVCLNDSVDVIISITDVGSGVAYQTFPNGPYLFQSGILGPKTFHVEAVDSAGNGASLTCSYTVVNCCPITMTGDVNTNGSITSADIIHTVNYVFKGGIAPLPCAASADVNCSGSVTSSDIIYLVNHVFKGGPVPCDGCTSPLAAGC